MVSLNINFCKFHTSSMHTLAPSTGQSCTHVSANNFWLIWSKFTSLVPLDSLDQADSNAPYDVTMRHDRFSAILNFIKKLQIATPLSNFMQPASNFAHMITRPTFIQGLLYILQILTVWVSEPIKFSGEDAKQEVTSYLSIYLRYLHQTLWPDPKPHTEWAKSILCHLDTRGRCD